MELSDAYLAGFFDGEGCIASHLQYITGKYEKYPRVSVLISISNVNKDVLDMVAEKYGGRVSVKGCGKNKNCLHWRINGKQNMKRFLTAILPYSVVKKEQIQLALELIESIREENLGCKGLPIDVHFMRQRVHEALRKRKLPDMRFVN